MAGTIVAFLILISWFTTLLLALFKTHLVGFGDLVSHLWLFLVIDFLFVGLFIVSHEACHGLIVPKSRVANLWIGRVAAFAYGGFIFDQLKKHHIAHHKNSGLDNDPDFHGPLNGDETFFRWISRFVSHYFSIIQLIFLCGVGNILMHWAHIPELNVFYFWVVPSILSALQLFYFGTFLPHRSQTNDIFQDQDQHRARNGDYPLIWSLLTCYHFGSFHRLHHEKPYIPWFRLPAVGKS